MGRRVCVFISLMWNVVLSVDREIGKPSCPVGFTYINTNTISHYREGKQRLLCKAENRMEKISSLVSSSLGAPPHSASASASASDSGSSFVVATVSSIFIYPIKSCRGISVPRVHITPTGFRWDRQWVIVNSKGRAYTQRVEPKLALIEVELPKDAFKENWVPTDGSYLVLRAPEMDVLEVPLDKSCKIIEGISVWEWSGSAYDEGHEASEWLTKYIGKPSCLMRFNTAAEVRNVDPNYALGHKTTFSDGFPFMVISQGSLNALNALLKEPLPINRFRPNILVDECQPFSEDMWKVLKVNNLTFHGVKLCSRCKVPTINQDNGIAGDEPTATLMKFRSDKVLRNTQKNGKVYFGQNLVWKESSSAVKEKVVKIGDPIYVLERFSSFLDAPI